MPVFFYVCTTPGCKRNKPGLYRKEETIKAQGNARCDECGRTMTGHRRAVKGPKGRKKSGGGLRIKMVGTGRRKVSTLKTIRKRMRVKR